MEVIVKYKGWLDRYRDTYMFFLFIKQWLLPNYVDFVQLCAIYLKPERRYLILYLKPVHYVQFTFEKQVNKQISFLDVLITSDWDQFCISVFRKETAIGLFTNLLGFTPFSYKVGLVRTLLHRAFMISSSWFLFHEEIVKIKHYLEKLLSPGFCW